MAVILARLTLAAASGIPADAVVSSFVFENGAGTTWSPTDLNNIQSMLGEFYNVAPPSASVAIATMINSSVSRLPNSSKVTYYDLSANSTPGLGAPLDEKPFTLGPANAAAKNWPNEVAVALSYHATYASIPEHAPGGSRPKARYRGRIFFGPVNETAGGLEVTTNRIFVHSDARLMLGSSANRMMLAGSTWNMHWAVWSRTDALARRIVGGWVDDAFDTQRRRGQEAVTRYSWGSVGLVLDEPAAEPVEVRPVDHSA